MTPDIEQHIDKSPGEPTGSQARSCTDRPCGIRSPGPDIATPMRSDLFGSVVAPMRSDLFGSVVAHVASVSGVGKVAA
jgi:hypothetical protein